MRSPRLFFHRSISGSVLNIIFRNSNRIHNTAKQLLLTGILLTTAISFANAQAYDWVTGGGSDETMSPSNNYERVNYMCTDADGNVYVTAITGATSIVADTFYMAEAHNTYTSIPHILLASYACDGTMRWAKLIEASNATYTGGITYSNGSIYMTGLFYDDNKHVGYDTTITSQYLQSFMLRCDTAGNFKWIQFVGPDSPSTEILTFTEPGTPAADGQGYIHNFVFIEAGLQVMPTVVTTTGNYDLKYDSTGALLSATPIPVLDSDWYIIQAIFDQKDGKYYAVISPENNYTPSNTTGVAAFMPNENMIWVDTINVTGNGVGAIDYKGGDALYAIAGGGELGPVSLGGLSMTDTAFPGYTVGGIFRLDTNGVAHWAYDLQCSLSTGGFTDVSILPNGQVAASGAFIGTVIHGADTIVCTPSGQLNPLFFIVDSIGNTVKSDQFTGAGGYDNDALAITSDGAGNIYEGGMVDNTITAGTLTPYTSNGGNTDFFVIKYGFACGCTVMPAAAYTYTATGTPPTAIFTYTGTTAGTDSVVWSFGDGDTSTLLNPVHTYTATDAYTACVTVYTSCGYNSFCNTVAESTIAGIGALSMANVMVYPNPAFDQLIIEGAENGTLITLLNMMGQQVYTGIITSSSQQISTQSLLPGGYIIQLTDTNGTRITRNVIKE